MTTHQHVPHQSHSNLKVEAGEAGYGLGIAGFITSFFSGVVGLILSAVALKQSKRIGKTNTFALVGFIIGIVHTVLSVLGLVVGVIATIAFINYCSANPTECQNNASSNSGGYNQPMMDGPSGSSTGKTY